MILLKRLTVGSRKYLLPESPLSQMVADCTRRCWRYSSIIPETLVPSAFSIPYYRYIHMDNNIHLLFIQLLWVSLVITRYIELLSGFLRIPCTTALQFFSTWIPLRIISRTYQVSAHPQWIHVFHKSLRNTIRSPKTLNNLLLLKFLLACIMINLISPINLFASLVIISLSPLNQYVANARIP